MYTWIATLSAELSGVLSITRKISGCLAPRRSSTENERTTVVYDLGEFARYTSMRQIAGALAKRIK
jgi:phosphatidylserine decarboxylase